MMIDPDYDFRREVKEGADPDSASPTLKHYHKLLWSKPLPPGLKWSLTVEGKYLSHSDGEHDIRLASDSIAHSYLFTKKLKPIASEISNTKKDEILGVVSTIGGFIIFPANRIDGKMTINGARGFNSKIGDRFDLTLECIKRFYSREESPLTSVLKRYSDFFDLFLDFQGYVEFFLLEDLVIQDEVQFFLPFAGTFDSSPLPATMPEYDGYIKRVLEFVMRRGQRLSEWCSTNLTKQ